MSASTQPRPIPQHIEELRKRGWRGGLIPRHRAFARLEPSAFDLVGGGALLIAMSLLWVRMLGPLGELWRRMFAWWARPLGLEGSIVMVPQNWSAHMHFALPYLSAPAGPITPLIWSLTALI